MFVHKNSQSQVATTSSALTRSEYVKPRQNESKDSPPVSIGEGSSEQGGSFNSEEVSFTSYSSFTVKPKSIKPMDLRSLQSYSVLTTPEKKRFSNLNVSTLVSPVTSLFNLERKVEGSKHSEVDTIRGPRYDAIGVHHGMPAKTEPELASRKSTSLPRPSLDALLESFHEQGYDYAGAHEQSSEVREEEEDDTQMELLASALSAAEGFHILGLNEFKLLSQDYLEHTISMETLKTKLEQELKFREGATSMVTVQTDKKMLEQAQEELASSERKVNQFSSELWRVSQSANLLERRCMQHVAGVLASSIRQGTARRIVQPSSSKQTPEVSLDGLSMMSTQLNEMSNQLSSFVKSQTTMKLSQQTEAEIENAKLRESLKQASLERDQYKKELEDLKLKNRQYQVSNQDLPALGEEEKDQMIHRLRQTVDECLHDISQLSDEKAEILTNLKYLYHRLPDVSLSRESSVSSKLSSNSEFDGKKFTDRIDKLVQENHRLMDRVVKLQHKSQFAKVDRRGALSPKDRPHGFYSNKSSSNPRIWLEQSSSDEEDSLYDQEESITSLGASLQNQTL
ncbi:hypothetical protein K493DRAFT_320805 [Basidiobolus meristosporus CBS 931.73]|uniref:Up-regulated during septation protein 1 domain-containing protein n=1 Tax=Basidiobolus meristosporus CBS 931.73 TaxID=1314790 RepID=A0A1Y1X4V9_9FUNG|nr:hypothetical protein K493DRAFT_320805 [Basidiobolus meristosporus CBS 931.73]|eukprot:ORX80849.1 hypothetical protein K493DRAFT_320805 [Basidiobolus meristosporus CBS 931.73]